MVKIRALNERDTSDDDLSTSDGIEKRFSLETQEQNLQRIYGEYLKLMSSGDKTEARNQLLKLYELIRDLDEEQASPIQKKLKFLTYRNLGDLYEERLDLYMCALTIDPADTILWIKTARRAFSMHEYVMARNCLESALRLSPRNWMVLDLLIDCYYILNDVINCFHVCVISLRMDRGYLKAQALIQKIASESGYVRVEFADDMRQLLDEKLINKHKSYIDEQFKRLNTLRDNKNSDHNTEKEPTLQPEKELNISFQSSSLTLNKIGEKLIQFYGETRKKPFALQMPLIINIEPESDDCKIISIPEDSEKDRTTSTSNSQGSKEFKIDTKEPFKAGSKETSKSGSRSRCGLTETDSSFPFEFVDKRRSSRVQRIQSRSRDLDEGTILDRIYELFCLQPCFPDTETTLNESKQLALKEQQEINAIKRFLAFTEQEKSECTLLRILKRFLNILPQFVNECAIPAIYKDVYRIYRHHNPLIEIDQVQWLDNFTLEELHALLCACELTYNRIEWHFAMQLLCMVEPELDEKELIKLRVRLLYMYGIKENNVGYLDQAKQLLTKLPSGELIYTANYVLLDEGAIKSQVNAQSTSNLQQYVEEKQYERLFELITPDLQLTEEESKLLCRAIQESCNVERGIQLCEQQDETLNDEFLQTLIFCLQSADNKCPPTVHFCLIRKLIKQIKEKNPVLPCVALLSLLMLYHDNVDEQQIVKFIDLAHQLLALRSLCTSHEGEFLLLSLQYLVQDYGNELDDEEEEQVLQMFFCLFGFSNRRAAFAQHCSNHVQLTWKNAAIIYGYFTPEQLPEFDTLGKSNTITNEVRDLLEQIIAIVPESVNPSVRLHELTQYLSSGGQFRDPTLRSPDWSDIQRNLYYFLADYYFKNKELDKAIANYKLDLCLNQRRFDSWAAIALALNAQLDEMILADGPDYYKPEAIFERASHAVRCYSNALGLDRKNTKIWIEFGNFVYNMAGYASRLKKTLADTQLVAIPQPALKAEQLDAKRNEMLELTTYCFTKSLDTDCEDERWLHYYVLGKVQEKRNILKALELYDLADKHLYLSGAAYPRKISYSPSALSIEALEVHYRMHAAVLKYILRQPKISLRTLARMKMHLLNALRSPFALLRSKDSNAQQQAQIWANYHSQMEQPTTIAELIQRTPSDVIGLVDDMVNVTCDRVGGNPNEIKVTLINLCLIAFKRCLSRFNNHYKSLYRLAQYFFTAGNMDMTKRVLLQSFEYTDLATGCRVMLQGLFFDRKPNNFFNGIWRIPVDDVERPGSFSRHMYNCIMLLIQTYIIDGDYNSLAITLAVSLSRTPDVNKKYLRDAERLYLAQKAFESALALLKNQFTMITDSTRRKEKILETSRLFERLVKMNLFVSESNMIVEECQKLLALSHLF